MPMDDIHLPEVHRRGRGNAMTDTTPIILPILAAIPPGAERFIATVICDLCGGTVSATLHRVAEALRDGRRTLSPVRVRCRSCQSAEVPS